MKKISKILLTISIAVIFSGSGYVGELPNLDNLEDLKPLNEPEKHYDVDVIPLDKLIIPKDFKVSEIEDLDYKKYREDIEDIIKSLDKIRTIIEQQGPIQQFVSAGNVLNLKVLSFKKNNKKRKIYDSYKLISDVNDDVQNFSAFWLYAEKNRPYISSYKTEGKYSANAVNDVKKQLLNILNYAIPRLREDEV